MTVPISNSRLRVERVADRVSPRPVCRCVSPLPARGAKLKAHGFSMVELLIAIMVLGIGLVMVATVFPVGLDMTRETIQKSITLGAVDTAVETVKLKVPTVHQQIDTSANHVALTFIPTSIARLDDPLVAAGAKLGTITVANANQVGIENDPIDSNEAGWLTPAQSVWGQPPLPPPSPPITISTAWTYWPTGGIPTSALPDPRVAKTRTFTEQSFFEGDPLTAAPKPEFTYILRPQNIPADYLKRADNSPDPDKPVIITDRVPFIGGGASNDVAPPRLHLIEHVYPALTPNAALTENLTKPLATTQRRDADRDVAREAFDKRRYNWTVIHHRTPTIGDNRSFLLTVVVTYRQELVGVYARQKHENHTEQPLAFALPPEIWANVPSPPSDPAQKDTVEQLLIPRPTEQGEQDDGPASLKGYDYQDTVFPRPWLVMLYSITPATGEVRCSAEVARLLPADSTFIIARNPGVVPSGGGGPDFAQAATLGFAAGTPHRVLNSTYNRAQLENPPKLPSNLPDDLARLQISKSNVDPVVVLYFVPVWVFPPAITRHPSGADPGEFTTRTPVVCTSMREVTLP